MKPILLQNLHWKRYNSPITSQYWTVISKGIQTVKFLHVLDFVDGMLCQDQSFIAKYILSIIGEVAFPESARSVSLNKNDSEVSIVCVFMILQNKNVYIFCFDML